MDAPAVQYVRTSDGYDIAYCVSGHGRPLIAMPGPFSNLRDQWDSRSYRPRFESVAARFTFIQYDCRGEGMSTRGIPDDVRLEHYELDFEAVISKFKHEPVILQAPAVSGQVAVRYAVRYPERLAALVLLQATLDDPLEGVRYLVDLAKDSWDNFLKVPAYNFYRLDPPDRALAILQHTMSEDDFFRRMRLPPTSMRELLPQVRTPTLVIAISGAYGPRVTGEDEGRRIAALIPNAQLLVLSPGVDFHSAVENFAGSLPQPAGASNFSTARTAGSDGLSAREAEVLRLLAAGRSNAQIGEALVISASTVAKHVSCILAKTESANRVEAAAYAHRHGLV